jgi:quercetin dioxygenase-like cupin family protein
VQATPTVLIDNERTRVTEWRFAPGAATGWHRHEFDYVIVPMLDGKLELTTGDNEKQIAELSTGVAYYRQVGVEHDVKNVNDFEYAFIEVEFK